MNHTCDVIIAGGGPAGATAACFLQRGGKRVLVLEKEKLPRYKACGGGLSQTFLAEVFPFSFDDVIDARVDTISYEYNNGVQSTVPCRPDVMAMVMRDKFDAYLLQQSGAEVQTGCRVTDVRETPDGVTVEFADGARLTADYLIGADGANSIVRRKAGLHQKQVLIGAIEAEVPFSNELRAGYGNTPLFIFDRPRSGYSWVFPKTDHLSVGIGALGHVRDLREHLERIMQGHGISLAGIPLHGHSIPVYNPAARLNTARIILAGDAAGLADPFSGEGIRPAIRSGQIAAEAILNDTVKAYTARIRATLGKYNLYSLLLWKVFNPLRDICLALGAPNPFTSDAILDLLSGRQSSLDVAVKSFVTLWTKFLPIEISAAFIELFQGENAKQIFYRKKYPGRKSVD